MDANLHAKTHLQMMFFVIASKFAKSANRTQRVRYGFKKRRILIREKVAIIKLTWKKLEGRCTQKKKDE